MYSLYHSLLAQHPRQLAPVPCAGSTITQLYRYFEDVVLENNLGALVVENLPTCAERPARDIARIEELAKTAGNLFLWLSPQDTLSNIMRRRENEITKSVVFERTDDGNKFERFVVIADARFSALLASVHNAAEKDTARELFIWTFEPDVVYSALEYLMARVTAEHSYHSNAFAEAVRASMPKATSLQLTLGVTTKLARLLQEQAEREIAVNRLATAIRNSLELDSVLQTAANEVGCALNVHSCAVRVEGALVGRQMTRYYLRPDTATKAEKSLLSDLDLVARRLANSPQAYVVEGDVSSSPAVFADAVVPLVDKGNVIGLLLVRSDDVSRGWAENELLLLHTVADQLTVAVNQAHMFAEMQQQAVTDGLTGCYNRRPFELRLEQNLQLATRMCESFSLVMMDLDNFKQVNDRAGHEAGDVALCMLADILSTSLRAVDTAARFGGDEFVIILPQADSEGALLVAERVRKRIEQIDVPGFGPVTCSFGIATFPNHASSRNGLLEAADRALYDAKNAGRNRVSVFDISSVANNGPSVEMVDALQRL
jgi:diguanylate cyclase (GGDEF)-like protein